MFSYNAAGDNNTDYDDATEWEQLLHSVFH